MSSATCEHSANNCSPSVGRTALSKQLTPFLPMTGARWGGSEGHVAGLCRVRPFAECRAGLSPSVFFQALGKGAIRRVSPFRRVFFVPHSANMLFTECPMENTRRKIWHSVTLGFPVVLPRLLLCYGPLDLFFLMLLSMDADGM